jgi:hypothetical protein
MGAATHTTALDCGALPGLARTRHAMPLSQDFIESGQVHRNVRISLHPTAWGSIDNNTAEERAPAFLRGQLPGGGEMMRRRVVFPRVLFVPVFVIGLPAAVQAQTCLTQPATIVGTIGNDVLTGTPGNDVIYGDLGNDVIDGMGGNDRICGNDGNDQLIGNIGNDWLEGGNGTDTIDGGAGADYAMYRTDPAGVIADLFFGTATDGYATTDTLLNIENLGGSLFNDILIGDNNPNIIRCLAGADIVRANGGNDTMFGNSGNDNLDGNDQFDTAFGGGGVDTCTAEVTASCP